jgi:P22 tail accessory factor
MSTKRQIIDGAFSELGLAGYAVDLQPEERQDAMRKLDTMLAMWAGKGIRLGYSGGAGDLADEMTTPLWADDAIQLGLAIRIAPSFGKVPSAETKTALREAMQVVLSKCVIPSNKPLVGYAGAGRYSTYSQNVAPAADIALGNDGVLDFTGDW